MGAAGPAGAPAGPFRRPQLNAALAGANLASARRERLPATVRAVLTAL